MNSHCMQIIQIVKKKYIAYLYKYICINIVKNIVITDISVYQILSLWI